ncbi:MAG: pyruvate kinase [Gammaproteobacteria bacterium]|nr:pyruvate kinase [Gammaproteobacteria bacterium]
MLRRTKIVATLGPASDTEEDFNRLIEAGVDVVRMNFSHGEAQDHRRRAEGIRVCANAHNRHIGILGDLQGPKIRIERFKQGSIVLNEGDNFIFDVDCDSEGGDQSRVGVAYKGLPGDVRSGDTLLLDDGRLVFRVIQIKGPEIQCQVLVGGELFDNKGINRKGGGLSASALTDKDRRDIKLAAEIGVDYLAVSFPRNAVDIEEARGLLREAGGHGAIVAKIERTEAVDAIDEIIDVSDAVMIARGDLGVEIGDAQLPGVQKRVIRAARTQDRVVITATQMMESMIENQIPTRAEVFDVANAVLDGTDAVMLSAETATGKYPAKAVEAMDRICRGAEKHRLATTSNYRIDSTFQRADEAIAMAAMYTANHLGVRAIAALTESGSTPLWMSRISSGIPIFALTPHVETRRKVTLYRGVYPIEFQIPSADHAQVNKEAVDMLTKIGAVKKGDLLILTKGDLMGKHGGTNAMKIVHVGGLIDATDA